MGDLLTATLSRLRNALSEFMPSPQTLNGRESGTVLFETISFCLVITLQVWGQASPALLFQPGEIWEYG